MEYKKDYQDYEPTSQCFLSSEDVEYPKNIFYNLDELKRNGKLDDTLDYLLKDWVDGYIALLPITTPLFFDLIENGRKHSYKATPEKLSTIISCLRSHNFDEIISDNPLTSDLVFNPEFIHVSGFCIRVYPHSNIKIYENRAGSFFNYVIKDNVPKCIEDQLARYQIYSTLINEKGERKTELEDCCFVYALKMSQQIPNSVLNQIRLRIKNRFLPIKCIEEICVEFKIHLIIHYINEVRSRQYSFFPIFQKNN